jgi:hypothetical protein
MKKYYAKNIQSGEVNVIIVAIQCSNYLQRSDTMSEPKQDKYARLCSRYKQIINKADNPLIKAVFRINGVRVKGYLNVETGECMDKQGNVVIKGNKKEEEANEKKALV